MGVAKGMDLRTDRFLPNMAVVLLLLTVLGCIAHLDRTTTGMVPAEPQSAVVSVTLADAGIMPLAAPAEDPVTGSLPAYVVPDAEAPVDPVQREQYEAVRSKSVLELQQFRRAEMISVVDAAGRQGVAALTNINPRVNAWYVLAFDWGPGRPRDHYHLENPLRRTQVLQLAESNGGALVVKAGGAMERCDLWGGAQPALAAARASKVPYASLCGGRIFLRNTVEGYATDLEKVTDLLRDTVWKGDDIVGFVRDSVYQDAFREDGRTQRTDDNSDAAITPLPDALLKPQSQDMSIAAEGFGLGVGQGRDRSMRIGRWYPVPGGDGVFASVMRPGDVAPDVVERNKAMLGPLDAMEASALSYFVAFDLDLHEMRFAMGTDHPRLNWSARVPPATRVDALPGPDGISSAVPLVTTGMVGPTPAGRVVAAFAAGFKREHGAFKWGELSLRNAGSHYGFVEGGAVLSKLQPGLSTLYTLDDGTFGMKTWSRADDALLPRVAYARQNGVPLVDTGADGQAVVGALVNRWGPGNWSGSADARLRTLRGGACLIKVGQKQFLVYGYFSSATPSAMAATFVALGCSHALNLDMNAPEHTYMALYVRQGNKMQVRHLVSAMANVDRNVQGRFLPRFISYPDNRDLFYMVRKGGLP